MDLLRFLEILKVRRPKEWKRRIYIASTRGKKPSGLKKGKHSGLVTKKTS